MNLVPENYQSVVYRNFGEPLNVLSFETLPIPDLQSGEVLIKMHSRSINPSDLIPVRGAYTHRIKLPARAGYEGVGSVVACADDIPSEIVGERVVLVPGYGTWSEYVIAPWGNCCLVDNELSNDIAAQLVVNPLTAWLLLEQITLSSGATLLVNACGSAIGRFILQLCRVQKIQVIAIVRNLNYAQSLLELGAMAVVSSEDPDFSRIVRGFCGSTGADAALDAVGGKVGIQTLSLVKNGGAAIQYGLLSGVPFSFNVISRESHRISFKFFWLREWIKSVSLKERCGTVSLVSEFIKKNNVEFLVRARYPLSKVIEAVADSETTSTGGKVLIC